DFRRRCNSRHSQAKPWISCANESPTGSPTASKPCISFFHTRKEGSWPSCTSWVRRSRNVKIRRTASSCALAFLAVSSAGSLPTSSLRRARRRRRKLVDRAADSAAARRRGHPRAGVRGRRGTRPGGVRAGRARTGGARARRDGPGSRDPGRTCRLRAAPLRARRASRPRGCQLARSGGGGNSGRSLVDALNRERAEEIGIDDQLPVEGPVAIVDSISPVRSFTPKHVVHIIFAGDLGGRSLEAVTSKDAAVRGHSLFEVNDLDGIVLHPPIARFLSRWQPGDPAVYLGSLWAR